MDYWAVSGFNLMWIQGCTLSGYGMEFGGLCINTKSKLLLTHVDFHGTQGVDRETLIGVNGNAEESRVCID